MAEDNSKKYLDKAGLSVYTQQLKNKLDETFATQAQMAEKAGILATEEALNKSSAVYTNDFEIVRGKLSDLVTYTRYINHNSQEGYKAIGLYCNVDKILDNTNEHDEYFLQLQYEYNGQQVTTSQSETLPLSVFFSMQIADAINTSNREDYASFSFSLNPNKIYNESYQEVDSTTACSFCILMTFAYAPESELSKVLDAEFSLFLRRRNFLALNNVAEYTPTSDYHPATKKYVDDNKFSGDYNDLTNIPIKSVEKEPIILSENYTNLELPETYGMVNSYYYYANCTSSIGLKEGQLYRVEIYNRDTNELLNSEIFVADYEPDTASVCLDLQADCVQCQIFDNAIFDPVEYTISTQPGQATIMCTTFDSLITIDIKIFEKELIQLDNVFLQNDIDIKNSLTVGNRLADSEIGTYSVATGYDVDASGICSHAEGQSTTASGSSSHAEGHSTTASGGVSHAEGRGSIASGLASHAEGNWTIAASEYQHVEGKYNKVDESNTYIHIVGNGTADDARRNAHTLDWDGNAWYAGQVIGTNLPYIDGVKTSVIFSDNEITQDSGSSEIIQFGYLPFSDNKCSHKFQVGKQFKIKINDNEYVTCECKEYIPDNDIIPQHYYLGNYSLVASYWRDYVSINGQQIPAPDLGDTGETFCILISIPDGRVHIAIPSITDAFSLEIAAEVDNYVQLDRNFIQEVPGKIMEAYSLVKYPTFDEDSGELVEVEVQIGDGAEIFNEYNLNIAVGDHSHAEGFSTKALGGKSHAEGADTIASGEWSHAEGGKTEASGECSHAEGNNTVASGESSHAEGSWNTASGWCSHAEGTSSTASGDHSHVEGYENIATGKYQHVQGKWNIEDANDTYAHIVGNGEYENRSNAHTLDWDGNAWFAGQVEGTNLPYDTKKAFELTFDYSTGYSDIWGSMIVDANIPEDNLDILNSRPKAGEIITISYNEQTYQMPVIVNGESVYVGDDWAFSNETSDFGVGFYEDSISFYVKGESNIPTTPVTVTGAYDTVKVLDEKYIPYAAGRIVTGQTFTFNDDSTEQAQEGAEIFNDYSGNIATGKFSHAEGQATIATGSEAHAEGCITTASGENSHAEGLYSEAIGPQSHAEGLGGIASGNAAHAEGAYTKASGRYQHVEGTCNIEDTENKYIHIAGNGEVYPLKRSNAYTLDWNGNGWFAGNVSVGADNKQLATEEYVDDNIANAKSDWFTSDETDPSYVKNRTHWKEITKEILVDTETLNASFVPIAPTNGETVYVNLNGTQYECVASGDKDTMTVGDSSYATVPFNFVFDRYGDQYIPNLYLADGYTVEVFEMSRDKEEYHKISENYLPERALLGIRGEGEDSVIFNYYNKELNNNVADGSNSFAQGYYARATGETSHAEGNSTLASGRGSHAEGYGTVASGTYSHAEGDSTIAASFRQHAEGRYNIEDTADKYAHIVGNGSQAKRANAYTLDWSGNAWYQGNVSVDGTPTNDNDLTTKKYVDDAINNFITEEELDAMLADIYDTTE